MSSSTEIASSKLAVEKYSSGAILEIDGLICVYEKGLLSKDFKSVE